MPHYSGLVLLAYVLCPFLRYCQGCSEFCHLYIYICLRPCVGKTLPWYYILLPSLILRPWRQTHIYIQPGNESRHIICKLACIYCNIVCLFIASTLSNVFTIGASFLLVIVLSIQLFIQLFLPPLVPEYKERQYHSQAEW